MTRIACSISRLVSYKAVAKRHIHITPSVYADKQKVDQLLQPLSQKYADAKDEVSSWIPI
jgi:hypothetical protein